MTLRTKRFLTGSALIVWMGIIFAFSQQPGSGANWEPPLWYILERKSAHVIEYAVLMLLATLFSQTLFLNERKSRLVILAFLFTLTYGAFDEIHQAFIFGRGSRFSDVLIDGGGALLMGLCLSVWQSYRAQRKNV